MSSTGFNFIILKINDIDCTNLSHDETFQIFLKSDEPILIKARRRRADDDLDKLYLFDDDWINSLQNYHTRVLTSTINDSVVNVSCQTDLPASCEGNQTPLKTIETTAECYRQRSFDARSIFAHCFAPEIDIEEVTLRKSRSDEKLGLTVSYSSINGSTSISASDDDDLDSDEIATEHNEDDNGDDDNTCADIYICDILPDSIAARDGRLRQGDQIIQINGKDVASKDETESLFAENKNSITLLVSRCACTEDEFLDSAVYCDEKDQNTGMSLSLDCEPSTYSSKSSLRSLSDMQKQQIPLQPITSLDTTVCDHANIRAQLESVNKEISLLNSQISNMKFQKDAQPQPPQSSHLSTLIPSNQTSMLSMQQLNQHSPLANQPVNKSIKIAPPALSTPKTIKNVESLCELAGVNKQIVLTNDELLQTVTTPSKRNIIGSTTVARKVINVVQKPSKDTFHNIEIEHIYETIPEDSDTDSYYCSPYDGRKGQIRIEQWLKSQDICDGSNVGDPGQKPPPPPPSPPPMNAKPANLATLMAKRDVHWNQTTIGRTSRKNSNLDDYENSSSAYNTGDSCTSNPLTLELKTNDKNQSSSTLVFRPYTTQLESYDNCKQCQVRYRKGKSSKKTLNKDEVNNEFFVINRSQPTTLQQSQNVKTASNAMSASTTRPSKLSNKLLRKAVTQNQQNLSEICGNSYLAANPCLNPSMRNVTGTGPNEQQQQVVQSTVTLPTSTDASNQNVENTPMVWKVKRRTDGSRYIVRRPIRRASTSASTSSRNHQIQQQYAQHHEIRQDQDQIICTTSGGGVLIKDEIITITESSKSSSYRQTASYKQTDNRHMRQNNDRKHNVPYQQHQQQRQDTLVNTTCNRNSRLIQKQWVI